MYVFSSIQTFRGAQDKEITILQEVSSRKIHPAARQTWNLNKVRKVSPCKSNVVAWYLHAMFFVPHITVWGSCFSLGTRRAASASARRRVPHSPHSSHLTHHSTTHHTSLITPLVNHTTLSHHSTTHHITPHSSQHYSSHHLSITPRCRVAGAVHRLWQAKYTGPSGGARSCCARGRRLARSWRSCGRRRSCWRSCCARGPAWPAAGFRVAGALHRAFWRSCCTRGRRLARGWLSCGRRSTQGFLFPTSLCGVLVFRLAPAAPLPLPRPPAAVSLSHHTSLITALLIRHHSSQHYSSHLTHHSTTHHTSLITALLITPHSSQHYSSHRTHHSTTHHTSLITAPLLTPHSSQHYLSHHLSQPPHRGWLSGGAAACFVWHAQYTEPSGGAAARVVAGWPAAFVWQAQYTQGLLEELLGAWPRLACAVHRAS